MKFFRLSTLNSQLSTLIILLCLLLTACSSKPDPITEAAEAHRIMVAGENRGKIVMTV